MLGALVVYQGGSRVVIYQIERAEVFGESDKIHYNQAPEAAKIKKLIDGYVKHPLK